MKSARILAIATAAMLAAGQSPSIAAADDAAFLSAYQGEWRGSGEARPNPRSKPMRISCRISAAFDPAAAQLASSGKCGSTQGSRNLNGTVTIDGDRLQGDFLGATAVSGLQKQSLKIDQNMLISEAEVEDAGKMLRIRTFLTQPQDDQFLVQSQFYDRAASQWVVASEIEFRRD